MSSIVTTPPFPLRGNSKLDTYVDRRGFFSTHRHRLERRESIRVQAWIDAWAEFNHGLAASISLVGVQSGWRRDALYAVIGWESANLSRAILARRFFARLVAFATEPPYELRRDPRRRMPFDGGSLYRDHLHGKAGRVAAVAGGHAPAGSFLCRRRLFLPRPLRRLGRGELSDRPR